MNRYDIPPGYVACGYAAVISGAAGSVPNQDSGIVFAPPDSEIENPWEDPNSVAIYMSRDTYDSLAQYLKENP
jgi:hypothetical protein